MQTNFNAEADQVTADAIVRRLVEEVSVESVSGEERRLLDTVVPGKAGGRG
jgi:hypothetical protein